LRLGKFNFDLAFREGGGRGSKCPESEGITTYMHTSERYMSGPR